MIFARARGGERRIASPDRPRDDLRAAIAQLTGDFGKESIVAHHHAEFAESRFKHRILTSRRNAGDDFFARQTTLRYLPATFPSGPMNTATL